MSKSSALLRELSAQITDLATDVANSIVGARWGRSRSSGFVWKPGLIVTADEVTPAAALILNPPPHR